VQILEYDEQRFALREPLGESRERIEQAWLDLDVVALVGRQPFSAERGEERREFRKAAAREHLQHRRREGAEQRKERVGEQRIRNRRLNGICVSRQTREAFLSGALGDFRREACLADAAARWRAPRVLLRGRPTASEEAGAQMR
jgi:hypothetical protein